MTDFTFHRPFVRPPFPYRRRITDQNLLLLICLLCLFAVIKTMPLLIEALDIALTDPQVRHEDEIAIDIRKNHSHSLRFEVAGNKYEVLTPNIALTPEQHSAWFNYAKRRGFPVYALDGPLAIDP